MRGVIEVIIFVVAVWLCGVLFFEIFEWVVKKLIGRWRKMTYEELEELKRNGYIVLFFSAFREGDLVCPRCGENHYEKERLCALSADMTKIKRLWCLKCKAEWEITSAKRYLAVRADLLGEVTE